MVPPMIFSFLLTFLTKTHMVPPMTFSFFVEKSYGTLYDICKGRPYDFSNLNINSFFSKIIWYPLCNIADYAEFYHIFQTFFYYQQQQMHPAPPLSDNSNQQSTDQTNSSIYPYNYYQAIQ